MSESRGRLAPASWVIELTGSELARIEVVGPDLVLHWAAARVRGDRSQLDPAVCGGHLSGVRWRLFGARSVGDLSAMVGRIDQVRWESGASASTLPPGCLQVPACGPSPCLLTLTSAWGDGLSVHARGWAASLDEGSAFTPSQAC